MCVFRGDDCGSFLCQHREEEEEDTPLLPDCSQQLVLTWRRIRSACSPFPFILPKPPTPRPARLKVEGSPVLEGGS